MSLYAVHLPNGTSSNTSVNRLLGQFLTGSGVVGTGFAVTAQDTPNMSVKVSGSAADDNLVIRTDSGDVYHLWNTSDLNVTISSNSSGVTKTDAIVAYADTALVSTDPDNPGGGQVIAVRRADALTGVPTDSEIDAETGGKPWLKLKEITVTNGALSINSGNLVPGFVVAKAQIKAERLEPISSSQIGSNAVDHTKLAPGAVIQVVTATFSSVATGTTLIPNDDTIPQNTEGNEYMTISITPKLATSKLIVEGSGFWANSASAGNAIVAAVFRDSAADALSVSSDFQDVQNGRIQLPIYAETTAGSTSSTTFKIRAGGINPGTITFNGATSLRFYGTAPKSFLKITEVKT